MKIVMQSTICRIMDDHSQTGRPFWAWLKNRHEYLRRLQLITNDDNQIVVDERKKFPLPEEVYSQPWGGIPFVYSFGDCCQLPPMLMKALYDDSDAKPNSSDNFGRLAFSEFINSDS